ncbi:DUF932 domain-containing protein [Vibrio agarivorans]|uniref:DUF932 domain-containing protein n=1 Tax=Vibrio agarivorans TaxID=153622 RepID=UPI0025B2A43B|nr:DUF932 domain-containing protein [Vibrio agarivorans]MDN3661110.1 DUF932 domain-containing protein [Vibrio agarivorans]
MNTPVLTRNTTCVDWNAISSPSAQLSNLCLDNRINQDIFFDVEMVDLNEIIEAPYLDVAGRQAIIDTTSNRVIAVHGNQYTLVKNAYAYDMVNKAITELGVKGVINVDDMYIKDECVNKGGKSIRQYIFPNHFLNFGDERIMMRIIVINSYDGSANFSLQVGGFRMVCLNGMVTGQKFMNLTKRHSGLINLGDVEKQVVTASKTFALMGDYWEKLVNTQMTQAQSDTLWTHFATDKATNKLSLQKFAMMNELYENHVKTLGRNHWAAYNSLTAWSTHYEIQERNIANKADVILKREQEVGKILANPKIWTPA